MFRKNSNISLILSLILAITVTTYAADTRTKLKPGWNLFSPEQDVEMGRQVAAEAESQLPILNDRQANAYIDALGRRLAARAPGEKYPYRFKIVNDPSINAFALPGGFIYIHRGAVQAADNEAQLAGVVAHEIAHVALRHGTNQASKAYIAQAPLAILGGVLGSNSIGSVLAQLGVSFATSSILLKYSRDAETQADLMGTQILHDSGYDPNAMVQFFEKIQSQSKGRAVQFLSDHPNPDNRISKVQGEIQRLGGLSAGVRRDSSDFNSIKSRLASMPAPRNVPGRSTPDRTRDNRNGRPDAPSGRMDGGIINNATDQLLRELRQSNPKMRMTRSHERISVGGRQAYLTEASNESPAGDREMDWIVTTASPDCVVYYFVAVAPQNEFNRYGNTFEDIINSVRFR